MKKLLSLAVALMCVAVVNGSVISEYGWEDGAGTILGSYGNVGEAVNTTEQANTGTHSLLLIEDPIGGTPQAYVGWVKNVQEGDVIKASLWMYDMTPEASPSGRIWGHYAAADDITGYQGSAGGNLDYPAGDGWSQLSYEWTVAAGKDTFVLEARIYSADGANEIYVDDVRIEAPDHTVIVDAAGNVVPEPATLTLLGLGGLFMARRKKQ